MELTLEDIKKELKDYYSNQTIIDEYERTNDKIERLIDRATYTGPVISDMPKGSNAIQDRKAELVAEYVDLQRNNIELEREYAIGLMKLKNNTKSFKASTRKAKADEYERIIDINENGTITINKDMTALINVHVLSYNGNDNQRSWIRLMNYNANWQYTACITYGLWSTSDFSIVLNFSEGTIIGLVTGENMTINSGGPTGSYIEIIELQQGVITK